MDWISVLAMLLAFASSTIIACRVIMAFERIKIAEKHIVTSTEYKRRSELER